MLGAKYVRSRLGRVGSRQPLLNRLDISDRTLKWLFLLPSVAILAFLAIYPFIQGIWMSFHEWPLAADTRAWVGLANYEALLNSDRFQGSARATVIFTGVSVTLELILGVALALYLRSLSSNWRPIFRTIFILPMVMTPIATGLMWRLLLNGQIGVVNWMIINFLGMSPPAWTSSATVAMATVIMIDIWQWTPLIVMIVYAGLLSIPETMYEAARVDGAPRLAVFRHITLPQIKYMIGIAVVFRLMRSFRSFDIIWLVTSGGPGTATEILNIYLYRVAFVNLRGGEAAALGIILLIVTIGITMGIIRGLGMQ
ncbi:carbohydrate ABC transporter permease [Halobellus marinus]|jgi:multiple sugar transport system permease protein|uniref:carbohydrate ABC transporter permease n=1 Tax=Halobellus TaxID=1073986 RepID=UPI0028AE5445|nr:sugar ABC transporter permease [Halobellus sp. DFY28]